MTYLEIMKKALDYYVKEPYTKEFNKFWQNEYYLEKGVNKLKIKREYRDLQNYLIFKVLYSKNILTQEQIAKLKKLEMKLTVFNPAIAELHYVSQIFVNLCEDPYYYDALCLLKTEELSEEKRKELEDYINGNITWDKDSLGIIETPFEQIITETCKIIADLFFSKQSYRYIPEEYYIENDALRQKCYELLNANIYDYASPASVLLDDYKSLYFSIKALNVILDLAKAGKTEWLSKLERIDTSYVRNSNVRASNPMLSILFNTKKVNALNLQNPALENTLDNMALNFFLGDNSCINKFSDSQISLLLFYYVKDNKSPNIIADIISNQDKLLQIVNLNEKDNVKGELLRKLIKNN